MNIITASMDNRDIQPHAAFQHVSPEDVKNCWDEADMAICHILWKGHEVYVEMTSGQDKEDGWCPSSWTSEFNMRIRAFGLRSRRRSSTASMSWRHDIRKLTRMVGKHPSPIRKLISVS